MSHSTSPTSVPATSLQNKRLLWLGVALAAHTGWGIYPVLARYLQTISGIPSLALLATAYMPLAIAFLVYGLPRYGKAIARSRPLWIFAAIVVVRSITNVLAARFTPAIYVQLITLMTPFIVALLSTVVLHERLPRGTATAMVLSFAGSALMLSSGAGANGVTFALTRSDWLGLALALFSALFLALYMIATRRTIESELPALGVLLFQSIAVVATASLLSVLTGESWEVWQQLDGRDWAIFLLFMLVVVGGANGLQIAALRRLGAPVVSSLMGWRLLSTLAVGVLLLGEGLDSWLQALGMVIVLATVTWYLWRDG